jgi:hypothetical protein
VAKPEFALVSRSELKWNSPPAGAGRAGSVPGEINVIRGVLASVAILLAVSSSAALAQPAAPNQQAPQGGPGSPFPSMQGTPEDQKACSPDAVKFCKDMIPDTFRVLSCLQNNRSKISTACQGTLAKYGQ